MSVVVTKEFIKDNINIGSITKSQCKILNIEYKDIRKGWMSKVEGLVISNASAELFKNLKGVVGRKNQEQIIREFKYTKGIK